MAGWDTTNFKRKAAQFSTPISRAKSGSISRIAASMSAPSRNGRFCDNGNSSFMSHRQQPRFGFAVDKIVRYLNEIDEIGGRDFFNFSVAASCIASDADIPYQAIRLHSEQGSDVSLP